MLRPISKNEEDYSRDVVGLVISEARLSLVREGPGVTQSPLSSAPLLGLVRTYPAGPTSAQSSKH